MSYLSFNILTFNHPLKEQTLYFTNQEGEGLTRIYKSLVPNEVIAKYGEQDHYFTSFTKENEGFLAITKPSVPLLETKINQAGEEYLYPISNSSFSSSVLKRYYNSLIHNYFKEKGFLVKPNFVSDTEVWLRSGKTDTTGLYVIFDRFSLKVQFKTVTNSLELLVTFEGKSKVFKSSVAKMLEDLSPSNINWVVYKKGLYRFEQLPDSGKREYDQVYPIWNFSIREALLQETEAPDKSNRYKKFKEGINNLYDKYLNIDEFKAIIPISSDGFISVDEKRIGEVYPSSNQLIFGSEKISKIPMYGIRDNGPFGLSTAAKIHFFFILHEADSEVSKTINKFFIGSQLGFKGLSSFIHVPYHIDKTKAIVFNDRNNPWPEIYSAINNQEYDNDIQYFAIYISPISKNIADRSSKLVYYKLKELLLKKGISSQVIDPEKVLNNNKYYFSLPNIAIAILAKLKGTPWKLGSKLKNELIIGIGAFKHTDIDVQYIGSAFSFSNNGKFNHFECFQKDQTRELAGSILKAVKDYVNINSDIRRLIIHFYKEMSKEEVEPIEKGLKDLKLDIPVFIVAINKTESSDIIAFDTNWVELMPVSGTFIRLGYNKFLLFNNTRYSENEFNNNDSFSFPIKLKISCSEPQLIEDYKTVKELIDQVYQFSRMYYKSVRQQNLPVTIKYPAMVAEMLPYFEGNEIPDYGKDNLWFL